MDVSEKGETRKGEDTEGANLQRRGDFQTKNIIIEQTDTSKED